MTLPYKISQDKTTGYYLFRTAQGLFYKCVFKYATPRLSPILGVYDLEIYDFDFEMFDPTPGKRKKLDERISATLVELIKSFFSNPNRVLIYICDASDGRHLERHKLFENWHKDFLSHDLVRLPVDILMEDEENTFTTHGCVLNRNDFPHKDILQEQLIEKAEGILIEKYGE